MHTQTGVQNHVSSFKSEKSYYPVIPFSWAVQKVLQGDYRTVGKRNAENQLEIYLCMPSGLPIAIVDFPVARSEVTHG